MKVNIVGYFEIQSSNHNVPNDMETFTLTGGLYAVFDYKGLSTDNSIFQYIFETWLPSSEYDFWTTDRTLKL
jgi:predicted transcriptional regulator YdeE